MSRLKISEAEDVFIGTWIGIAIITEVLIDAGFLGREEIVEPIELAAAAVREPRRWGLDGILAAISRVADLNLK